MLIPPNYLHVYDRNKMYSLRVHSYLTRCRLYSEHWEDSNYYPNQSQFLLCQQHQKTSKVVSTPPVSKRVAVAVAELEPIELVAIVVKIGFCGVTVILTVFAFRSS